MRWMGMLVCLLALLLAPMGTARAEERPHLGFGHVELVRAVAFSPDGRFVLTGSDDNIARLWDAATGKEMRQFTGHGDDVNAVAFSPDGRFVLTGSDDGTARLWDAATGKEARQFTGHDYHVKAVAFSPDSRFVLTGSWDDTARLWDAATGQELQRLRHRYVVNAVAFSPDGRFVLTGGGGNIAHLWDAATGKEVQQFTGLSFVGVRAVAFSPDGRFVLTGSDDKTAHLWDAATGKEVRWFRGHGDEVTALAFSPDGRFVLTGSHDNTARLWDAATGKEVRRLTGHKSVVNAVAFSPEGRFVLTGSWDRTARLWDAATGKEVRLFTGHGDGVNAAAFSPNGRFVLTGNDEHTALTWNDPTAHAWDAATGQLVRRFEGYDHPVRAVAFSPDGHFVLTGSSDNTARLWDAATGKEVRWFNGHGDDVTAVAFSPDGRFVLTGSTDKTARLWDAATGKEARRLTGDAKEVRQFTGHSSAVTSVAFSPNARFVLTGSRDNTARLWDAATGQEVRRFTVHDSWITAAVFSPDGHFVLTGSSDKTARLWDAATGKEVRRFTGHNSWVPEVALRLWNAATGQEFRRVTGHAEEVNAIAFSPDGRFVLTGSGDKTACLWDAATGQEVRRFTGHGYGVRAVAFSPDGRFVLTGGDDKTARLWDAETGQERVILVSFLDGWIAQTPEGYFTGSDGVEKHLGMVDGLKMRAMTPDDITRWKRPDLVAAALGVQAVPTVGPAQPTAQTAAVTAPSPPQVTGTPTPTPLPPPGIDILSPADRAVVGQEPVQVTYRLLPGGGEVAQVLALIDGQPASQARSTPRIQTSGDDSITLSLPPRDVVVTLLARGPGGDGPSVTRRFIYKPPAAKVADLTKPDLYVVAAGISDYADSNYKLNYADDDARALVAALKNQEGLLYRKVHVSPLPNAKKNDIARELFELTRKVGSLDRVVILLAGHGALDDYNEFVFLPQDVQADDLYLTGLPQTEINRALKRISGSVLLFLDACRTRADGRRAPNVSFAGLQDELSRDGKAVAIINAAQDGQASLEDRAWGHGALTFALLEALNGTRVDLFGTGKVTADLDHDGDLTLSELDIWLTKRVAMLTKGAQHPKPRRTTAMPSDLVIAKIGSAAP